MDVGAALEAAVGFGQTADTSSILKEHSEKTVSSQFLSGGVGGTVQTLSAADIVGDVHESTMVGLEN